ncbi:MAG: phosphoribosylformylglycinamidine synthase subunit PurQ [Deltaproteobacteria bacterium]|nr:phosphoribosylformylglycinamidine synthase subunit PurQ [Deltaproteobacteria bacterium]
MKVAVVVFPGSNCDHDVLHLYGLLGQTVTTVWHRETDLHKPDLVVLPGGFSHGDYLRTGALAKLSPIMHEVKKFADQGGPVIGICNGFQILCEAGLLPGVLLQNVGRKFLSQFVTVKVENSDTVFTRGIEKGRVLCCPIAHFDGNYFADDDTVKRLEDNAQVVFRYCDAQGGVDHESRISNPNGARNSIAGICSERRNVVGLMPHPERAAEKSVGYIGGQSGRCIFEASLNS